MSGMYAFWNFCYSISAIVFMLYYLSVYLLVVIMLMCLASRIVDLDVSNYMDWSLKLPKWSNSVFKTSVPYSCGWVIGFPLPSQ